jgi:hypothetical protein
MAKMCLDQSFAVTIYHHWQSTTSTRSCHSEGRDNCAQAVQTIPWEVDIKLRLTLRCFTR